MKNLKVKVLSAALAASMVLSVAACNKKGSSSSRAKSRSGTKITSDTPWFDAKTFNVDAGFDSGREIEYTYQRLTGADDQYIIILTTGNYKMPDDIDWDNWDYNEYAINVVTVVDRSSNTTVRNIDLTGSLTANDYLENASYSDGILTATCSGYDPNTYEMTQKQIDFDISTGKQIASREMDTGTGTMERSFKLGKYRVDTEIHWDDMTSYILHVVDPNGDVNTVEVAEKGKDYYDIPVVLPTSDTTALVPVSTDDGYIFFELDLTTLKLTSKDAKDYEWIDLDNLYSPFVAPDGSVYFSTSTGINKIDFKKKETSEFFNYSWCGLSRNKITYLEIADITENSFILCGEYYEGTAYRNTNTSTFSVIEFTRAATNPHAGKTILELYAAWGYTEDNVSEAIMQFKLGADSNMSNQLAMDILNGEGPDILLNVSTYGQLNSKSYLADLTPYVGNLSSEKYFTNIIEAAKVDGNLFNLPVCFTINGIQTDAKYAGASGVGFTTKEYEKFLNDTLNGTDVITSGQPFYFAQLFTNMSDKFIKNGKADFSSEEFKELAEFVKNNVRESSRDWDDYSEDITYESYGYAVGAMTFKGDMYDSQPAVYISCYGMSSYLNVIGELGGAAAILGIPSTDGRGPSVDPYVSVAVSSQACSVDACGEFVKMLLSDDVQEELAMRDNFVLDREAFRKAGKAAIEYYNSDDYDDRYGVFAAGERTKFTEKNIDELEKIVLSCSKMNSADAAINLILVEEMPAYFSGQKDLDNVIRIAQDRAQKVLDERG